MSASSRRRASWPEYRGSIGDRSSLFATLAEVWGVENAVYPGSYVDLSPSTAIRDVTHVDTDARAARYFADTHLIQEHLSEHPACIDRPTVAFIGGDYTKPLGLAPRSFDLLISLYAGPVWDHCGELLKPGGLLLANASHGDASLAALDPDLEVVAAVEHRADRYRLVTESLDRYLVPKSPAKADPDLIRASGRGIAYTRPAFAYLFRLRPMTAARR